MQLTWLLSFFETSPSIGLLRSTHAPFILHFLQQEFKSEGATRRGMEQLTQSLRAYLDHLHDSHPDVLTDTPENYLAHWCHSERRYLRRVLDTDCDEPQYELTSATEDVLTFLDGMARRDTRFIGTESRLKRIISTLRDLALGASGDAEQRLEHLYQQRRELDREIAGLEAGDPVETYLPTAIRERFAEALADLVQLQGDFRAVEEAFKEIIRDVQKRQFTSDDTRGAILGQALDAEQGLKGEDQGVSFDEFARLILSPAKQEHVESILREVANIETLAGDREGLQRIREMVPSLTAEARKVLRTYQRLSTTLRRLLDRDVRSERQRLAEVLGQIRGLAVRLADIPPGPALPRLELNHELLLDFPLERPFWSPPTEFEAVALRELAEEEEDRLSAFADFARLKSLDWPALRKQIDGALAAGEEISLGEILAMVQTDDAPHHAAVEVMGMIQIAHEGGHDIDTHQLETTTVLQTDGTIAELEIPRVTFRKHLARSES